MRAGLWQTPFGALIALSSIINCSSPNKGAEVPTVAAPAAQATGSAEEEAPLDLSPVAAPDNIVAVASVRAPARTLDTAMGFTGLGLNYRTLLESGPFAPFLPVIDLDAPVDAIATLDPKVKNRPRVMFAVSLGLTSRQAALDVFREMETNAEFVEPGVHMVRPSPKTICFIAAALGKANARLVCGEDRESLDALSPYLTRGNPSEQAGDTDVHVELRAESAWRIFGDKTQFLKLGIPMFLGEVSIGNPEFDDALRDAAVALVDEVILELEDLKNVRLDAWLRGDAAKPELELALGVNFRGTKSWMAQSVAGGEANASVAPESFWQLPLDATEAVYYSPSNPERSKPVLDHLERLLRAGLTHLGASPAVEKQWPLALREAFGIPGPTVSARGPVPAELLSKTPDARENLRASFGYTVLGIDDEQNRYGAWLEQTLKLYEDTTLRKSLASKYGVDPAKLPKVTSRRGPAKLNESHLYEVPIPAELMAKTQGDEKVDPATLGGPIPIVIVTCREGKRTWLGFSSYPQVLEERLIALTHSPAPDTTVAKRTGLERLRQERSNVAGFWTLAGLQNGGATLGQSDVNKFLSKLGNSDVPIIGQLLLHSAGPSSKLEVHVPAQLFRDVATAVTKR